MKSTKTPRWLLPVLGSGLILRLISINQSLWMDEAISGYAVKDFSLREIATRFILSDTHPPLYYLLLKVWTSVSGYSEFSLRLPSVIFGVLTVYFIYRIARLWNAKTAFYATVLGSVSPLLVYYSQEARMYSLSCLLVTMLFWSFTEKRKKLFSLTLLMLGMTDYFPLMVLIPLWMVYLLNGEHKKNIWFITAHFPLVLFLIFWFPVFRQQSTETMNFVKNLPAFASILGLSNMKNLLLVWIKSLIGRIDFQNDYIYGIIILTVSVLVVYPVIKALTNLKKVRFAILWYLAPIITSFIFAFKVPGFSYFRLLFTVPALVLLIAYGLSEARFGKKFFYALTVLELSFCMIYLFNSNYWREDWKSLVPFVESRLKPGEKVMYVYKEIFTPYDWYSKNKTATESLYLNPNPEYPSLYTLDYLLDLTDPGRAYYGRLEALGYRNSEIFNFRGAGQVRYWTK